MSCDVTLGFFVKLSNVHLFRACLNTTRTLSKTESRAAHPRRNPRVFVAMCPRVAIRAYSSPCAALRRLARLSRGCSFSRRENAEMLVHSAFCKQNYPFTCSFSRREGGKKARAGKRKAALLAPRVKSEISRAEVPRRAAFLVQRDRSTL